jgi:hypothetical protein
MKDKHKRPSDFRSRRGQMHGRSARNNYWGASRSTNLLAGRGFEARLACDSVPSLRTRMRMGWSGHPGIKYRLHILSRVVTRSDWQRPDSRHVLSGRSTPTRVLNGKQPSLSKRLKYGASLRLSRFGGVACWKAVKVPKRLRSSYFADRIVREYPAPNLLCALAHGTATATRHGLTFRVRAEDDK